MSEIRSTIDIMMERTRGMGLSEAEKEQISKDSLSKKAKGYALKIHDYTDSTDKIVENLFGESPDELEELKKLVWNDLVSKIQNDQNLQSFLDVLQKLAFAPDRKPVFEKYRSLLKYAQKDKSKDRKLIIEREKRKLADSGISGTAVVPKIPKDSEEQGVNKLLENLRAELVL